MNVRTKIADVSGTGAAELDGAPFNARIAAASDLRRCADTACVKAMRLRCNTAKMNCEAVQSQAQQSTHMIHIRASNTYWPSPEYSASNQHHTK